MYYVLYLSHDKAHDIPAIGKFPLFGINVSFYTDVSESSLLFLLCHSQEILETVTSFFLKPYGHVSQFTEHRKGDS